MTVYVDELQETPPWASKRKWPYRRFCHMAADTVGELVLFAKGIGLRTEWFQTGGGRFPHFDLTEGMRRKAVAKGAVETTLRKMVALRRAEKVSPPLGPGSRGAEQG